ncbi:glycosyltransferase family 2 protein [Belnapia rosea]|uniref:glycosyltransferase family 2 protein n=1 Tax=Belnapia rosea TaxID=938405 RepID=UPI0008855168|nr:glycosyltransferase family 2 protein [Belnapia rosea]SDB72911.1 Glycosyltransferase, GT2 family [Belnapia rosea]
MMPRVCAVVLTYNRRELLDECLRSIAAQSHVCDRVIVVDNASTDGTAEMLAECWRSKVDAHVLEQNIGAAGGFNLGMRLAYRTGADYIWVMDDDVMPEPDALEKLLAAASVLASRNIAPSFLTSILRSPVGHLTNVPEIDRHTNPLQYENWPDLLDHKLVPVIRAALASNLLPRSTLEQYGLPIADMFIWGEDTEFTLRVAQDRPGFIVGDSRAVHVRQLAGVLDIRTERNPARVAYHFYRIRNDVFLKRRFEGPRAVARLIRRQVKLAVQLCQAQEFARARIVLRGVLAGLSFNPSVEAADAPFTMASVRQMAEPEADLALASAEAAAPAKLAPEQEQAFPNDLRPAV